MKIKASISHSRTIAWDRVAKTLARSILRFHNDSYAANMSERSVKLARAVLKLPANYLEVISSQTTQKEI